MSNDPKLLKHILLSLILFLIDFGLVSHNPSAQDHMEIVYFVPLLSNDASRPHTNSISMFGEQGLDKLNRQLLNQ